MNTTETIKQLLSESDILDAFNGTHIDYIESNDSGAGLYSTGPQKIREDILGNPTYRMNFQLYTGMRSFNDYDRIANSDTLVKLTYYLDTEGLGKAITETYLGTDYGAQIVNIVASNAMYYDVPTGDYNDGVRYQLLIAVDYKIFINE